ncbi:MAG: DUF4864 domain-containing protein [Elainellaceae cyanobacterium]
MAMRDRLLRSLPLFAVTLATLALAGWVNSTQQQHTATPSSSPDSLPTKPFSDSSIMELTNTDRAEIRTVIEHQLQAFQQENAELAFSYASPAIQAQFETAERFMVMVESLYPAVYRPRSVMFENIARVEGKVTQRVILMAPDGSLFNAFYMMQIQPDESWRIDGCVLTAIEGQSV